MHPEEPGFVYVGYVTPLRGSAKNIANSIIPNLADGVFSLDELNSLGCNRTIANAGWRISVMRLTE